MNDETRAGDNVKDGPCEGNGRLSTEQTRESAAKHVIAKTLSAAHQAKDEGATSGQFASPPNLIPTACQAITPQMLPLVNLDQRQIDAILQTVPGGAKNVQDIYPLSPLQEGMLFHRLLNEKSDTYVLSTLFELQSHAQIGALIDALQRAIDRHDVLRTAVLWENLPQPVQVVYRQATLPVVELVLDRSRQTKEQLNERMRPGLQKLALRHAPMGQLQIAADAEGDKWYALLQLHHLVCDHQSLKAVVAEAMECLRGGERRLPDTVAYRDYVAHALADVEARDGEVYFRSKLGGIDEATAPFGLFDVHGDGSQIEEARQAIDPILAQEIRIRARRAGVSTARLFHAAWALVVAHTSGREDVVYGTVLLAARHRLAQAPRMLGMSVNTLPLRIRLQGITAAELLEQTHEELRELRNYQHVPLTLAQRCSGLVGTAPLFTALLNYRHSSPDLGSEAVSVSGVRVLARGEAWTNYPIAMTVDDLGDGFELTAQTDKRIKPNRVIGYLRVAVRSLADALERAPQTPALDLSILPDGERYEIIEHFNATQLAYPREKLIHELFEEQVARTPYEVAVIFAGQHVTYAQLNCKANQLARYLKKQGVGPECFVGLCIDRGVEMVVGVLGILKAGAAYVPLDPNYPQQRLDYMLQDSAPSAVLSQDRLKDRLPRGRSVILLDTHWSEIAQESAINLTRVQCEANSSNLAYVIYTSGSTGQPKGVAIEHCSAVNLICWAQSAMSWHIFERTLYSTSLNFDLSVYECFVPLATGGSLHVVENALALVHEPVAVTLINTVPSAIKGILDSGSIPQTVCVVNLAGEPLKEDLVQRIFASSAVESVCNLYGPSETTTYSTWVLMSRQDGFIASIGRPIANTQVYILDRCDRIVPIGVVGEIYIGGAGVARGYLNRPELTAERFLPDPLGADPQARMYKTGDLGRWRTDGTIEYLGRNDHQVKIRGFRIELGEIEAQLLRHAQVEEAVVTAREDVPGEKRLVAYLVATNKSDSPSIDGLRTHLKGLLPEYMIPGAFMVIERLPRTPNGKLDRGALPPPEPGAYASRQYEPPQGEVEEILAGIWQALLRLQRVGRRDNFFELGGHSLLIVQMMERLRRVGLSTELRCVFESPTLAELASALTAEAVQQFEVPPNLIPAGCQVITPQMLPLLDLQPEHIDRIVRSVPGGALNTQDIYPLAPLQEGILFHHLLNEHRADTYILQTAFSVSGRGRLNELIRALQSVIDRHDVLRTAVIWEGLPRPVQVVHRQAALPVEEVDLDPDRDATEQVMQWIRPQRQQLNLQSAPLMRLRIAADPNTGECYAMLQLHHIVIDHVTMEVMVGEVVAHLEGRVLGLPEPSPYRNHVAQAVAYAETHDAEAFFRSKLADVSEPTVPFGLRDVHGDGSRIEEARLILETALAARIRAQARCLGVSAATLFHAAWGLIVARTSARDDVVFGSVLLGRLHGSAGSQQTLGMFINTLPIRLQLRGLTAKELVERTQRELVDLLGHDQASLAVAQRCSGVAASTPLFSTLLNYRHSLPDSEGGWSRARGVRELAVQEWTNYPITLSVDDLGQGFTLTAQSDRLVDPHRVVGYLHTAVRSLVDALERAQQTLALALPILPECEVRRVTQLFNATECAYPQEKVVHELFEAQVQRTPYASAVMHEEQSLTYAELNRRANRLAHYLRNKGIGPDQLVGICIERSLQMVVGLLAVLKAGGAYVPLDPSYPVDRLQYMLDDANPRVILTQADLKPLLAGSRADVVVLDDNWEAFARYAGENLPAAELELTAENLAYVIYTSGSTGRPKGTAMPHRSMVNLIEWHRNTMGAGEGQRVLQFAALSFDVAFQETFSTFCTGGTLVLLDEWVRRDMRALAQLLNRHAVERLFVPPLLLQSLAEYCRSTDTIPRSLKDVITAGEQLRISPEIINLFRHLNGSSLHNHYGPTETHVVTALTLPTDLDEWPVLPTIGRPISNTQIYIMDEDQRLVPIGVAGEIYIGGAGVARGYFKRPELTAERFVSDPFNGHLQARLYRTGDLGRWRSDGTIEYLGRNDDQVKIRGYRIELGEIEAQLALNAQVKEAVVVAREDIQGEKRLVGYVTLFDGSDTSVEELRVYLRTTLPEHMVPSALVILKHLPVTPSGKVSRRVLPAPELDAYVTRDYEAPQTDPEEVLAGIWQDLLQVERVGRHDNFFELGGHSLLIVQMMERLRCAGLVTDVRRVFESKTLADLASMLMNETIEQFQVPPNLIPVGCEAITPQMLPLVKLEGTHIERIARAVPGGARNIQDIYPLTPLQEGMLFHHLLSDRGGDTYVRPMLLSIASQQRLLELIGALQKTIDRHDVLRTAVLWEHLPRPVQVVHRQATLPIEELLLDEHRDPIDQLKRRMSPEYQKVDLRQAPLIRLQVAIDPRGGHCYALLQTHHLVCDNESLKILTAEVTAHLEGDTHKLPEPMPYRSHVAYALARGSAHDIEAFFHGKLANISEPTAPFGLLDVHGDGSRTEVARRELQPALSLRLRAQARRLGVTAASLFHAAWALVTARTSGRDDVVFGTVLRGRAGGTSGAERTVGMFINTLPLRLRLEGITARELAEQTQCELAELLSYEQAPLATVQRCSGMSGSTPLFSALLNYLRGAVDLESEFSNAAGVSLLASEGGTNYPVVLLVNDRADGFALEMRTDRRIDPSRMLGYMSLAVQSLVDALDSAPQTPALVLSILPEGERQQVIETFNPTYVAVAEEKLIHHVFEEQVERTPNSIAVVYEQRSLTYSELNGKANQLARYLRGRGVGPDQLVGICVERHLEMVVGLLGILKAGGAYVPLDPNYPTDRLQHMLEDSAPSIVLTQEKLRSVLPATRAEIIALDSDWTEIACEPSQNLGLRMSDLRARQLAYVMYTSGSTGKPKGVMVEHRNVVRLFAATDQWFRFNERDVWTLFHSYAFDFSVWELWGALLHGGRVVVVPFLTARSPQEFYRLICEEGVTVLNQTPSAFAQLIDAQARTSGGQHALRVVIFGGEALELHTLRPWVRRNGVDRPRLVNMYGITETTVHVTYRRLIQEEIESERGSPIGEPIPDLRVYLLDRCRQPVPIGVAGEMYVGGAGVARGYLNRPDLTAERFVADPFNTAPDARLYRSGDLGRWRPDGALEYLGRNDDQVKIRGFRIELGEIEAQLARHEQLKEVAVIAREDIPGERCLVAYVVPFDPEDPAAVPSIEELRTHLRTALPEYMVPSAFVVVDCLPLTSNGKLDRRALPAPEFEAYAGRSYEPPEGDVEETVAAVWRDLLGIERVGRHDNFFDIGGHSLLAMQVAARIQSSLSIEIPIRFLFEFATLRELSMKIEDLRRARLLNSIADGDTEVDELLASIASLPESRVQELLHEWTREERL